MSWQPTTPTKHVVEHVIKRQLQRSGVETSLSLSLEVPILIRRSADCLNLENFDVSRVKTHGDEMTNKTRAPAKKQLDANRRYPCHVAPVPEDLQLSTTETKCFLCLWYLYRTRVHVVADRGNAPLICLKNHLACKPAE